VPDFQSGLLRHLLRNIRVGGCVPWRGRASGAPRWLSLRKRRQCGCHIPGRRPLRCRPTWPASPLARACIPSTCPAHWNRAGRSGRAYAAAAARWRVALFSQGPRPRRRRRRGRSGRGPVWRRPRPRRPRGRRRRGH